MKRIFIMLTLFVFSLGVFSTSRALLFGLGSQEDAAWAKVNGDRDVALMKTMLTKCGFRDIRVLTNASATKEKMVQAFLKLEKSCRTGDIIYIHYSGHGQYMTDVNGDESLRWTGRHAQWDESWVPYDAQMIYGAKDHGEKHFCDDEVAEYLQKIRRKIGKNGRLYVVVDACHSGDATCGEMDEPVRGVDREFIIPRTANGSQPESSVVKEEWLTVSACKPYQLCFEQKNPVAGKLTYAIYTLGAKFFKLSNSQLQKALDDYIQAHPGRFAQNPVVSGHF